MNKYLPIILTFVFTLIFATNTNALTLTEISGLPVTQQFSEYDYTGKDPTFTGTSSNPNSQIVINIEGQSYTTTSDASGNWQIQTVSPQNVNPYTVQILADNTEYSFILNVNYTQTAATTTTTTAAVPETGINQITSIMFTAGILLMALYLYFWGTSSTTNSKLEKYYIKQ